MWTSSCSDLRLAREGELLEEGMRGTSVHSHITLISYPERIFHSSSIINPVNILRDEYGASVATLCEGLNRLTSEGFVVAEGQRGFEVAPVSAQYKRKLAEVRLLVENQARVTTMAV